MSLLDRIIGLFAPHNCLSCKMEGNLLCVVCLQNLPAPRQRSLDGLESVKAATSYNGLAKALVWQLKSKGAIEAASIMASSMCSLVSGANILLVPVPTASTRVRVRGYDQANKLARAMARKQKLPYAKLLRRQTQSHQVGSNREQRQRQIQNAFHVRSYAHRSKHIVLIDDVLTTGSTLQSAAKTLRVAGYKQISALVFVEAL